MTTWWLAIDRRNTSYEELKHRKVVAQGWPGPGDLRTLCALVRGDDEETFLQTVDSLVRVAGYANAPKVNRIMWNLLSVGAGDLVVGVEGIIVRGICELNRNGWESYQYQSPEAYNYAQTIGFPVKWIDWDAEVFGFTPIPPRQGVPGVRRLQNESHEVLRAWREYPRNE